MNRYILKSTIVSLIFCAALVTLCYFYVDRSVADFVYAHNFSKYSIWFEWSTHISPLLLYLAPIVVIILVLKKVIAKQLSRLATVFLAISVNLIVTVSIKDELKFVFGRYWPATWIDNNPSWLQNHAYGFHFFHSGKAFQSFPSGHTAIIFAVMSIIWMVYPKWRWLSVISCMLVMLSLLALNYHFVSDIIVGGFLGSITGMYTVYFMKLKLP